MVKRDLLSKDICISTQPQASRERAVPLVREMFSREEVSPLMSPMQASTFFLVRLSPEGDMLGTRCASWLETLRVRLSCMSPYQQGWQLLPIDQRTSSLLCGEAFPELGLLIIADKVMCCGDLVRCQSFLKMRSPEHSVLCMSNSNDSYLRRHWNSPRR